MSLTRFRSQSHQLITTHEFTIKNAQRVTQDCVTHTATKPLEMKYISCSNAQALNILATILSPPFPHHSHTVTSQHGTLSHCINKRPSFLKTLPQVSPKIPPNMAPRYPSPHPHIHSSPRDTLVQHVTRSATPLAQFLLCPL